MDIKQAIDHVTRRIDLQATEMTDVMRAIMTGEATPAQIGGFLVGLRMKGETVAEIAAAAGVMRELVTGVTVDHPNLVDIVGTGGDGAGTFNISTTSTFVVAAAGGQVAKHGNRSVSSSSGSADVLEQAGVNLELNPEQVARCVDEVGVGFMFAPLHHSAMRHAIGPRREMGVRTLFNLLGPLTNPAGAPNLLLGVYDDHWVEPIAEVLHTLGAHHAMVVHSEDGLDEISIGAATRVAELKEGRVRTYTVEPEALGVARGDLSAICVASATESLALMKEVLDGRRGPARDITALNAGAAIYVAGLSPTLEAGVERAVEVLDSGAARGRLDALVDLTCSFKTA
ncbi:MAG: anthranilate phosphoribosyltransferase [Gammaproteobacteria bacterium]|nr:anthranilate phosphoribosyltransferase [Gammaproteobacteria bacterium]